MFNTIKPTVIKNTEPILNVSFGVFYLKNDIFLLPLTLFYNQFKLNKALVNLKFILQEYL